MEKRGEKAKPSPLFKLMASMQIWLLSVMIDSMLAPSGKSVAWELLTPG
jgi:hypothetical protein